MASPKVSTVQIIDESTSLPKTLRALDLSGTGAGPFLYPADNEPERATYGAFAYGLVPPANPTDFIHIKGSATKTIRVKSITISGTATAATNIQVNIYKRTAAYAGNTATTITGFAHDTTDDAVTAVVAYNTVLGTPGAGGIINGGRLNLAPAANGSIDRLFFQYAWMNDKAPILRGVTQFLAINFAGAAWPSGGAIDIAIEWCEE